MINKLINLKDKIKSKYYFNGESFNLLDTTFLFDEIYKTIEKLIEYIHLSDQKIQQLKQSNQKLQEKIDFFNTIYEHSGSLVSQMHIKTKNGNPVWVDSLRTSIKFLETLDKDDEVDQWIHQHKYTRYSDKDY